MNSDGNNVGDTVYCIVPPEVIGNDAADRSLANKRQCQLSALFCASASGQCHPPLECQIQCGVTWH